MGTTPSGGLILRGAVRLREVNADEKRRRRRESGGPGREAREGGSKRREYLPVVKVKTKRTSVKGSTVKGSPHWHSPGEGEWALGRKGGREGSRRPFGVGAVPPIPTGGVQGLETERRAGRGAEPVLCVAGVAPRSSFICRLAMESS